MLEVEVSDTGTGTVYIRDGKDFIVVSACSIPDLMVQLAKGLEDFRSNIEWEWKI
jgi:hypothetical protein|tara:strand:- start:404 stop:568 length:165 start_codon:yes stop_codon:yes gene_type:complete